MIDNKNNDDVHLAFRNEGQLINAYVERAGRVPLIVLLGSINRRLCERNSTTLTEWRATMSNALSRYIEEISGQPVQFEAAGTEACGGTA